MEQYDGIPSEFVKDSPPIRRAKKRQDDLLERYHEGSENSLEAERERQRKAREEIDRIKCHRREKDRDHVIKVKFGEYGSLDSFIAAHAWDDRPALPKPTKPQCATCGFLKTNSQGSIVCTAPKGNCIADEVQGGV